MLMSCHWNDCEYFAENWLWCKKKPLKRANHCTWIIISNITWASIDINWHLYYIWKWINLLNAQWINVSQSQHQAFTTIFLVLEQLEPLLYTLISVLFSYTFCCQYLIAAWHLTSQCPNSKPLCPWGIPDWLDSLRLAITIEGPGLYNIMPKKCYGSYNFEVNEFLYFKLILLPSFFTSWICISMNNKN